MCLGNSRLEFIFRLQFYYRMVEYTHTSSVFAVPWQYNCVHVGFPRNTLPTSGQDDGINTQSQSLGKWNDTSRDVLVQRIIEQWAAIVGCFYMISTRQRGPVYSKAVIITRWTFQSTASREIHRKRKMFDYSARSQVCNLKFGNNNVHPSSGNRV